MNRVLVVKDQSELFTEMLESYEYEVVSETDRARVLELLRHNSFRLLLLDLVPPASKGLDLLQRIRQEFDTLPVLVATPYGSAETTVAAMELGATDFVNKPVEAPILQLRILKTLESEYARELANTDGLTGLYNHRFFQERLQQEINRAHRYEHPLSLILADIDHFKIFNDTYGHPKGDEALIEVARILRSMSRSSDIVARYGGEEFAVVLPETSRDKAQSFGNRIRDQVSRHPFLTQGPPDSILTISAGIATCDTEVSKEELIQAADGALYQAKREGRNRVCVLS